MLEAGERFAADKLAELPEDLVELALHHHILVISLEELALLISEGEGQVPLEKVVEDSPYLEFGDYCVIGRSWDSWETIATVLTALDERHSNSLQPMLERLWRVTERLRLRARGPPDDLPTATGAGPARAAPAWHRACSLPRQRTVAFNRR